MDKSEVYILISNNVNPMLSFGESIRASMFGFRNFKTAFNLALSDCGIKEPSLKYRAALERVNRESAVQIEDKLGPHKVTIARIIMVK